MTKQEIGQVLRAAREAKGLTQKQVAEMLDRKQQIVGHWETGYSQPDANTLFALCDIYGINIDTAFRQKPAPAAEVFYISHPSGDASADEIRKYLHEVIDQLPDEDLALLKDMTIRLNSK